MKRIISYLALVLIGLMIFGVADVSAKKKAKKGAVVWAAENLTWKDRPMKGGPPGVKVAALWGNMGKGAYGAFVKLPSGMNNPLHTHSSDTKLVVISGSFWYAPEGGEKQTLGPGSYLMVPKGVRHTSGTESETVTFQQGNGKFDFKPVKMAKAAKAGKK